MKRKSYNMKDALADPARIFGSPLAVVSDPRLDKHAKLEILKKWRQDAEALSRATEEGMSGESERTMLKSVLDAINRLKSPEEGSHRSG